MDLQKAKSLALHLCEKGIPCTLAELCNACKLFPVTPLEIRRFCELPGSPLLLLDDTLVSVTAAFPESVQRSFFRFFLEQGKLLNSTARHGVNLVSGKEDAKVTDQGSKPEPEVTTADYNGVNKIKEELAMREIEHHAQVDHRACLVPGGERLAANCSRGLYRDVNPNNLLESTEKPLPAKAAECPIMQGPAPIVNDVKPKQVHKKSREPRGVPRFEDFSVEGEVGAGGYGTVYKVQRLADGRIFAIKCPLENTHDSCVQNEINMLKRLRGRDFIIQFYSEVKGKLSPKSEAGGEREVDCPSIVLEFIEHDKPEVLKKEITIEELRNYSFSLFKALAQLHKERILHLDVKPGNFLFSRSNKRGCLVDFNLARDESGIRFTSKRPQRDRFRTGDAEVKIFQRKTCRKRSLLQEDSKCARVTPSKRSRQILELSNVRGLGGNQLGKPASNVCIGDQSKATLRPVSSTDSRVASPNYQQVPRSNQATGALTASVKLKNSLNAKEGRDAGNLQQVGPATTQETLVHGPRPHVARPGIMKFLHENVYAQSTERKGVRTFSKIKRIGAEVPPEPRPVAQPSNVTRVKAALRVKGPCHPIKDGPCVGTKGYRAPEVLMRSLRQTTKVDIWSAGVSLLQLVTGRSPFPSTSTDGALKDIARLRGSVKMEQLAKSLGQRRRFSKDSFPGTTLKDWSEKQSRRPDLEGKIPLSLYDLIEKCLEVNPDTRITAEAALLHQFCTTVSDVPEVPYVPLS